LCLKCLIIKILLRELQTSIVQRKYALVMQFIIIKKVIVMDSEYYVIDHKMNENLAKIINAYLQLIYKQESYSNVLILDNVMQLITKSKKIQCRKLNKFSPLNHKTLVDIDIWLENLITSQ
jgi:hypothetical protein